MPTALHNAALLLALALATTAPGGRHAALAAPLAAPPVEDATADGPVVHLSCDSSASLERALRRAASVWRVQGTTATVNFRPGPTLQEVSALPGVNATVMIPDLAQLVSEQAARRKGDWRVADSLASRCAKYGGRASQLVCGAESDPFFNEYREMELIHLYMEALALEHPTITEFIPSIGASFEGHPIPALIIGGQDGGEAVFLQAELHAREWITPSTAMWIAVELLESEDPVVRALVQDLQFIILPLANPDGYLHTWTQGGRQWRKSRSPQPGTDCLGTDLNRNWDSDGDWGGPGASDNPCSGTFRGAAPFSEAEVGHIRAFLDEFVGPAAAAAAAKQPRRRRRRTNLLGGIDIHSFGQIFLRPYAWATTPPPNDAAVEAIGEAMAAAAAATPTGVPYREGPWFTDLYPSSGVCADYLHHIVVDPVTGERDGVAFTSELRDTGQFGFVLPDSEIVPTGVEQMAATVEFAVRVLARHRDRQAQRAANTTQQLTPTIN